MGLEMICFVKRFSTNDTFMIPSALVFFYIMFHIFSSSFFTADPYDTIELLRKQLEEKVQVITSKDKLLAKKEKE